MMNDLLAQPHVFWLSLGGILLAAEMLGTSGYLLWSGIAAVVTGLLVWVLPLGWESQGVCFAILTLVAVFLWWRWLTRRKQPPLTEVLNQRGQQLVGRRLRLESALVNGRGNIRIGDSSWPVVADSDLPADSEVIVVAVEGILLKIRAS